MSTRFIRNRATWALYAMLALFAYLQTSLGPVMPFVRTRLDLSYTVVSLHFSAFAAGAVVVGALGDRVVRRFGRTTSLWGGLAGMLAGFALIAIGPSVIVTLAGAFAAGFFGTVTLVTNQAALSDLHRAWRMIAITESNVAASASAILAPLAIGWVVSAGFGWQVAIMLAAPVLLLLWFTFRAAPIPSPAGTAAPRDRSAGQHFSPLFWLMCGVMFLNAGVAPTGARVFSPP